MFKCINMKRRHSDQTLHGLNYTREIQKILGYTIPRFEYYYFYGGNLTSVSK